MGKTSKLTSIVAGLVGSLALLLAPIGSDAAAAKEIKKYTAKTVKTNKSKAGNTRSKTHATTYRKFRTPQATVRTHQRSGSTRVGHSGGGTRIKAGPGLRAAVAATQSGGLKPYRSNSVPQYNSGGIAPYHAKGITPSTAGAVLPKGASQLAVINGQNFPVTHERRRLFIRGATHTFVPVAALAAFYLAGRPLYPYGYVSLAGPYCRGVSENGCALNWQAVEFEDGGSELQCVEFCPRGVDLSAALAFASAPAAPAGRCEAVIYSDANLAGINAPTREDQPRLSETGWKDQISSIEVKAGTWDFYSDDDYSGDALRLVPGAYRTLDPQWAKHIGSMICVQPPAEAQRMSEVPVAGCELVIYSEPNFAGTAAPTGEDQPRLVDVGWKNVIASIEVKAGNWEVYADDEYRGEAIRLAPGRYAELDAKLRANIASFKCTRSPPGPGE